MTIWSLILSLWPLYQFTEITHIFPFRSYFFDLLILAFVVFNYKKFTTKHPLFHPALVFVCAYALSLLVNGNLFHYQGLYLARIILYLCLIFITSTRTSHYLSGAIVILLGMTQYYLFPDMRFLKGYGFDDHYYRLIFPFFDPNFVGAILVFLFFYFFDRRYSTMIAAFLVTSLVALVFTFSRASYTSLIFGLFALALSRPKIRPLALLVAMVVIVGVYLAPKPFGEGVNLFRTFSINSRIQNFQTSIEHVRQNPIFGYPNEINPDSRANTVSNSYLFLLSTGGLTTLLGFIYFIYSIVRFTSKHIAIQIAFMTLFVHSFFNNTFFYAPILIAACLTLANYGIYLKAKTFSV